MTVDYNSFAKKFANSRKNMKWEEVEYFLSLIDANEPLLDIWCGSGRLLEAYQDYFSRFPKEYNWLDMSEGLLLEAKKQYPDYDFFQANMLEAEKVLNPKKFKNIFLIASFHHLQNLEEREKMMVVLKQLLDTDGKIYMTNWSLDSSVNQEKYSENFIAWSTNMYGSKDYSIKFWEFERYYHSFSLEELEYLAKKTGFNILENRLFDTEKNIITILQA